MATGSIASRSAAWVSARLFASLAAVVALASFAGAVASASAATYCVNTSSTTGCDHTYTDTQLQNALDDAGATAENDVLRLGSGTYNGSQSPSTGFAYSYSTGTGGTLHIEGPGSSAILTHTPATDDEYTVAAFGSAVTVDHVLIRTPQAASSSSSPHTGLSLGGIAEDVEVDDGGGAHPYAQNAVQLGTDAVIRRVTAQATPGLIASLSVWVIGTGARVEDSTLGVSNYGLGVAAGKDVSVVRSAIDASGTYGVYDSGGTANLDDVLLSNTAQTAMFSFADGHDSSIHADDVTVTGTGNAAFSNSSTSGLHADVALDGVMFRGLGTSKFTMSGGTATVSVKYSDFHPADASGATLGPGNIDADPGFTSGIQPGSASPLLDAGDPAALSGSQSQTDFLGNRRVVAARSCTQVRDIGAVEFQDASPRASASASPGAAAAGQPVSFDAAGSCGVSAADSLTYTWSFDDGAAAAGALVQHAFATGGAHAGTVTVTNSAGRTAQATAVVNVSGPPAVGPFVFAAHAGAAVARFVTKLVLVDLKTGKGTEKIKCANVADDWCDIKLAVTAPAATKKLAAARAKSKKKATTIGTARGRVPGGKTSAIVVKLSAKGLRMLKSKHSLHVVLTGSSANRAGARLSLKQALTLKAKPAKKKH